MLDAVVILLCFAAVLAWMNERFAKIPASVGVTLAVLFAFIGVEVRLTETTVPQLLAALALVAVALGARVVSVSVPIPDVRGRDRYEPWTIRLFTWGGLGGGIALSLALSLPDNDYTPHVLTTAYAVVPFTIAVQRLSVMPIVRRAAAADELATPRVAADSTDRKENWRVSSRLGGTDPDGAAQHHRRRSCPHPGGIPDQRPRRH